MRPLHPVRPRIARGFSCPTTLRASRTTARESILLHTYALHAYHRAERVPNKSVRQVAQAPYHSGFGTASDYQYVRLQPLGTFDDGSLDSSYGDPDPSVRGSQTLQFINMPLGLSDFDRLLVLGLVKQDGQIRIVAGDDVNDRELSVHRFGNLARVPQNPEPIRIQADGASNLPMLDRSQGYGVGVLRGQDRAVRVVQDFAVVEPSNARRNSPPE